MSQAAQTTVTLPERCETCVRWLRYKGQAYGRCGKRGGRTPGHDWCRYFTREEEMADAAN